MATSDAKSKVAEVNQFAINVNMRLTNALSLMENISAQQQSFELLISDLVAEHPVLDHMREVASNFDATDAESVRDTYQQLRTVLETVCSVLKLDAVSFEAEILKRILEKAK